MDFTALIGTRTSRKHVAWGMGYCPHCEHFEAFRLIEISSALTCCFIPVFYERAGSSAECGFCERDLGNITTIGEVPLGKWSPAEGLEALISHTELRLQNYEFEFNSVARLRSLLAATQDAISPSAMNVSA